jgi:glycerol-3-phosphate dehydrogenase (NAD(P)+)
VSIVTILGAGAMGSALATPLRERQHEVRLWGTRLDDHLIDACAAGKPHPRTGAQLAAGTRLFHSAQLDEALRGADVVVLAVASVGVSDVMRLAASMLGSARFLVTVSKGFHAGDDGQIQLLTETIREILRGAGQDLPVVAVGGPCKANEVAIGRPTATVFASSDVAAASAVADLFATPSYRPQVTDDEIGLELSAPLKNVYAIALGFADGLQERDGEPWHNLKAASFGASIAELALLVGALGGDPATAFGLSGVGDLEVTALSGRNKVYGARIGSGEEARAALAAMAAAEQTVEGVPACALALRLVAQRAPDLADRLPLLHAIAAVIDGESDSLAVITRAVLP